MHFLNRINRINLFCPGGCRSSPRILWEGGRNSYQVIQSRAHCAPCTRLIPNSNKPQYINPEGVFHDAIFKPPNSQVWGFSLGCYRFKVRCTVFGVGICRTFKSLIINFETQQRTPNLESFKHPTLNPQTWELCFKTRPGIPPRNLSEIANLIWKRLSSKI